ncbi:flippase-like domain-containing protein [bacterium]|nr:flippase-like domain-containing protein [bacterium]
MSRGRVRYALRMLLVAGISLYLARSGKLDLGALAAVQHDIPTALYALVLTLLGMLLVFQRWRLLLRSHDIGLGLGPALRLTLIGIFFSVVLPGGLVAGDLVKACYVSQVTEKKGAFLSSIVFDKIMSVYTLLFIAGLAAADALCWGLAGTREVVAASPLLRQICLYVILGFLGFSAFLGLLSLGRSDRKPATAGPGGLNQLTAFLSRTGRMLRHYRVHPRLVLQSFVISLYCHLFTYSGLYMAARLAGAGGLKAGAYLFILPLGTLINSIPLTPGGLGLGEAGFDRLCHYFGSPLGAELAVIYHAVFFFIALSLGGAAFLLSGSRPRAAGPSLSAAAEPEQG